MGLGAVQRNLRFTHSSVEEVQNVVTGELSLSGITLQQAEDNKDAIKSGIADSFGIDDSAITSLEFEEATSRRRLDEINDLVAVYEIEVESEEAGETLAETITETETTTVAAAIEDSVDDATGGTISLILTVVIEDPVVTTEEELEIAPTAAPETDAPTMLPTPVPTGLP